YSVSNWDTASADALGFRDWDVKAHTYYAQANWGILNNVDLIALIGGRSVCMDSEYPDHSLFWDAKADGVPMFLWGVGVKATFFRADNGFYFGGGALFTHSRSNDFNLKVYLNGAPNGELDGTLRLNMLTPELHLGWHFGDTGLTAYTGVDYVFSRAIVELENGDEIELHVDHPVYGFIGLDYFLNDKLYINVEGRGNFVDGWGVESGIGYMFDLCAKPAPAPEPAPAPVIEPKLEPMSKN
ncbi:MAG: hypothetical protein JW765_04430, partial [Deltaproteobacteria bacterium]|nr:hypothetical protein [Candidatus Zymogenaceae bacterium]